MFVVDVNVLLFAFRRDSAFHVPCREWLEKTLAGEREVALSTIVEIALLRISTLARLGPSAAPPGEVFAFLAALHRYPRVIRIEPIAGHYSVLEALVGRLGLTGNDLNDAHLALLALERRATLVSTDRGFRRFPDLDWFDPSASEPAAG